MPRLLQLLLERRVLKVEALAHLSFTLDDSLQLGDVLVQQFVLVFRARELVVAHLDLHVIVVGDLDDLLLQRFDLLRHVAVGRLQLLLQRADLLVLAVSERLEVRVVPDLHGLEPLVLLHQLLLKVLQLLFEPVRVLD